MTFFRAIEVLLLNVPSLSDKEIKVSIKLKQLYGMFLSDRKSPEYKELSGNVEQAVSMK